MKDDGQAATRNRATVPVHPKSDRNGGWWAMVGLGRGIKGLTPLGKRMLAGGASFFIIIAAGLVLWHFYKPSNREPGDSYCKGILGRPLRVGVATSPGYAPGIVANNGFKPNEDSLYYRYHGLCAEFVVIDDTYDRIAAFERGGKDGVDILWSTVDSWANELPRLLKNDVKARVIMQVDWSRGGTAIVASNDIHRIEDLVNKKIALRLLTPAHWLLEFNLRNSLLTQGQQEEIVRSLVNRNDPRSARADFVTKRVDVVVLSGHEITNALNGRRGDSHILVSTKMAQKLIASVLVARESFIKANSRVIQEFVEGWIVDGTEKANTESGTVVNLLVANETFYKSIGPERTQQDLSQIKWAGLQENAEMFNLEDQNRQPLFDSLFSEASGSWQTRGYITSAVDPITARDDRFVRKIYEERAHGTLPSAVIAPPTPTVFAGTPLSVKSITVNFKSGTAELDDAAKRVIDDQVSLLPKVFSGAYIRVEGNTDASGAGKGNRRLSQDRAQAVVDYLVNKYNLPAAQFSAIGNGSDHPVAPNDTPDGRARNRRTDISVFLPMEVR